MVLVATGDIFHSLFHPSARTTLSGLAVRGVWIAARRLSSGVPRLLLVAGPLGVLAAILAWAALLVLGWALIYWPWMPEGYLLAPGVDPSALGGFADALYLSLVTLGTLGFGDIVPAASGLRLAAPMEGLVGFGLLTASLTWVLSLYPVLRRMRTLAEEVLTLEAACDGDVRAALDRIPSEAAAGIVSALAGRLIETRTDLVQTELVYYFHSGDRLHALADALPVLLRLAEDASADGRPPELRLAGRRLGIALDAIAETLAADILRRPGLSVEETLRAYAEDHRPGGIPSRAAPSRS
jgi:hypothetical protein